MNPVLQVCGMVNALAGHVYYQKSSGVKWKKMSGGLLQTSTIFNHSGMVNYYQSIYERNTKLK